MYEQNNQHYTPAAPVQKLTSWQNEPSVVALKCDFEMSKSYHDTQAQKIDHWNDLMKVTGKAKPPKVKGRSSVQPKLVRRQAEWRYSALTEPFLSSDKLFKVKPRTFEDTSAARSNELLLNYQWDTKLNKVKFIDDFVRSTVDEGTCIVRIGWKRITVPMKTKVPVFTHLEMTTQEQLDIFQQALELRNQDPRSFNEKTSEELKAAIEYYDESGQPTVAFKSGERDVTTDKVVENRPVYDILNPKNFWLDPTCNGDIEKAMFAIVSFETCKADLLKEPKRYKNLDKVQWDNNTPLTENDHQTQTPDQTFGFKDQLRKKVVAYEYWGFYDVKGDGTLVPIVATWIGDVMIRMEENPFPDQKLPFVLVPYLPVKREAFGEPDAELLEDNQKILGAVTRGIIDLLGRSANGQQGFAKGMLDPLNKRRYENGQDYEFNPNMPPQQGLIEHKYPEIPTSALTVLQLQNQDAEALSGVKSFAGGISGQAYGDVVAGIRGALDAASKREMAILRRLAKGITDIGNKTVAMNSVFLSDEEVVRVTNTVFERIKRDDLPGNFDLMVDISTPEIDDAKAKDLGFMLQTLGNTVDIGITIMILAEIADLKKMPELAHKLRNFQPKPDPIVEETKRLELEKLKMEVAELRSKAQLNQAKAQEAASNADKTDLDYVEQETGTTHERRMEELRSQARGNQNLEVTKSLTKPIKEGEKKPDVEAAIGFNELSEKLSHNDNLRPQERDAAPVDNILVRDELGEQDPRYSLNSSFYQPDADPAMNPGLNL